MARKTEIDRPFYIGKAWFSPSNLYFWLALSALVTVVGCTAGSQSAVRDRFPADIVTGDFKFFETDWKSCTFAEVSIDDDLKIDPSLMQASLRALDAVDPVAPFGGLKFPESGFHYFSGLSVIDLASLVQNQGDEDLAYDIGETFFKAKECWRRALNPSSLKFRHYQTLVHRRDAIIVIGAEAPNTVLLLFPSQATAFYFGP